MRVAIAALFGLAGVLALALVASKAFEGFAHRDEHQFIVPGLLTMREGLLPYRDYPLFHMPYLVLLHGALGAGTGWPLLSARAVTGLAAWLTLLLLGAYAWRRLEAPLPWRVAIALGVPGLLLLQPLFAYTMAVSWNHAAPAFLVVLAFLLHCRAAQHSRPRWLLMASGAAIGAAACMRLTFLPLLVPFAGVILLFPARTWRERWRLGAWFSLGALVAAAPAIGLLASAPEGFLFGNLDYPKLSTAWRKYPISHAEITRFVDPVAGLLEPFQGEKRGLDLARKLEKGAARTVWMNWPLFSAFLLSVFAAVGVAVRRRVLEFRLLFLALLLPFIAWGAIAPSRFHLQYYFPLLPVMALAIIETLRLLPEWRTARVLWVAVLALAMVSVGLGARQFASVAELHRPQRWGVVKEHRRSWALRQAAGPGAMLTLNPLRAAESGLPVYRETSSGEFGFRVAHLLPRVRRQRLHLACAFDLAEWLGANPPASLFLDTSDPVLNGPIARWAEDHGYRRVRSFGSYALWRPALAAVERAVPKPDRPPGL